MYVVLVGAFIEQAMAIEIRALATKLSLTKLPQTLSCDQHQKLLVSFKSWKLFLNHIYYTKDMDNVLLKRTFCHHLETEVK